MSIENENSRDPRARLSREKYFSIRPRPLERWLWAQGIASSAERVFWLHWQEGVQRGDWCSELPLRRVARECHLDVSTVTRAYQWLTRMGCLRRTDPGRDPANPFQQATAVTEVRLPRELLLELNQHPNRRAAAPKLETPEAGRVRPTEDCPTDSAADAPLAAAEPPQPADPFSGLRGRDRVRALAQLTHAMSAQERADYQDAIRLHRAQMNFAADTQLTAQGRAIVLKLLSQLATAPPTPSAAAPHPIVNAKPQPRPLSVFELARLKREIQAATSTATAPELLRQVVWSIEAGALRRFSTLHALHIALKKIREGAWNRPHRMPPNWARTLSIPAVAETCSRA